MRASSRRLTIRRTFWRQVPVDAIRAFEAAGFDELALLAVGPDQDGFLHFSERQLAPALAA